MSRPLWVALTLASLCTAARAEESGQLVIVSTPPGATIVLDGARIGHAPITKPHLLPGEHVIEARWPGGATATSIAKVTAGASAVVRIEAEAAPAPAATAGQLVIATTPPGATVSIDGRRHPGATPTTVRDLPAGPHVVTADWPDGRHATANAQVTAGSSSIVQLKPATPTTGDLTVESEPAGAQIAIDGRPAGTAPITVRGVSAGAHGITGAWTDGRSARTTATVPGGSSATVRVTAPPLPTGQVVVTTDPSGASIDLDGKRQPGSTPMTLSQVTAGTHLIAAEWPDGRTAKVTAIVVAGISSGVRVQAPPPAVGQLVIMSEPSGAIISVDGKRQSGAAPITVTSLPVGSHTVSAEWSDGRSARTTANVTGGASGVVRIQAPAPTTGTLAVTTDPPGAQISVDGRKQPGPAPLTVRELSPGAHVLVAEWPDGRSARATANIAAGASTNAKLSPPAPTTGQIVLDTHPAGAQVQVDGKRQSGTTPMTVRDLAAGAHTLSVDWPDGRTLKSTTTVAAGSSAVVHLEAPVPQAAQVSQLSITTEPAGASISVDGKRQSGTAPLTVANVAPGTHEVTAEWSGGRTAKTTAMVTAAATASVRLQAPAPAAPGAPPSPPHAAPPPSPPPSTAPGSRTRLVITSDPSDALINLDNVRTLGTAPVTVESVWAGAHTITAEFPDGRKVVKMVMVTEGSTTKLHMTPPKQP